MNFPLVKAGGLHVPACSGEVTLHQALALFDGNGSDHRKNDVFKEAGPATPQTSFMLVEYPNAPDLLVRLGNPNKFEMTQHQIALFCELHKQKLRTTEFGTHFIFRSQGSWCVLRVRVMFGLLYLLDYHLYNKVQPPFQGNTIWLCERM